jgi:hypothetical protein
MPVSDAMFDGFGLDWTPKLCPFQCSISVFTADPVVTLPTAKQLLVAGQEIPRRLLSSEPATAGVGVTVHVAAAPTAGAVANVIPANKPIETTIVPNFEIRDRRAETARPAWTP